jgi:hypothetical protein
MAKVLDSKLYVDGGYLDSNISVSSVTELIEKVNMNSFFLGQSVHMSEAFYGVKEIPYPIDFWSVPNGDDIKWEIKSMPAIESEDDFGAFKDFINEFKRESGYFPISKGTEILVNGTKYTVSFGEDGNIEWIDSQSVFDETVSDAVDIAVEEAVSKITSGASAAFDTLKEIEDWINASGSTDISGLVDDVNALKDKAHTHDNKDVLDEIDSERVASWDDAKMAGGTVLDEKIVVTRDAGNYTNGMTIEEGTSVLDVLKNFFHKTLYPNVATKPSAKLELNGLLESEYEVGSVIEIPAVSVITEDGKFNYTDYKGVMAQGGEFYEISIKSEIISGFKNFDTNNIEEAQSNIVVSEGNNEILYTAIAKYEAPSNKPTTNEGVETTHTNANLNDNAATWEKGEIEMTLTVKVDGYKNVYFGTTNDKSEISEDLIKSLNASNKVITEDMELTTSTKNDDNHNRMIIAVPENKTLQLVEDSTSTQDLTKLILITEKKIEISSKNGLESVIYNVYDKAWAGSFGNETWKIKIKNK